MLTDFSLLCELYPLVRCFMYLLVAHMLCYLLGKGGEWIRNNLYTHTLHLTVTDPQVILYEHKQKCIKQFYLLSH